MRQEMVTPDGREIVLRTPDAKAPHPHPYHKGKLVPFRNMNEILLHDGATLFECDLCGYSNVSAQSTASHMTSHGPDRRGTRYPRETLVAVARAVKTYGGPGARNAMVRAASQLNEQGVRTIKGREWSPNTVSGVFNAYCKDIKVRVPRRRQPDDEAQQPQSAQPTGQPVQQPQRARRDLEALEEAPWSSDSGIPVTPLEGATIETLTSELRHIAGLLGDLQRVTQRISLTLHTLQLEDPALVRKAQKWDDFIKMTRE